MGTTKLMHMKECSGKTPSRHLKNAIEYIFNPAKTGNGSYVGGNAGITSTEVYKTMIQHKKNMGKERGRQGYHFVITFPPGEVDEKLAFQITEEFCEAYFQNEFQHTFTVHNDKEHMHAHIIFNSIDMNGKKYRYEKGDWEKYIQKKVNQICKEHGLFEAHVKKEHNHCDTKEKWQSGKRNWYQIIREDIDKAVMLATNYEEFLEILKKDGYHLREGVSKKYGNYLTLCPEGGKATRNYRLGVGYEVEEIKYKIAHRLENQEIQEFLKQSNLKQQNLRGVYLSTTPDLRKLYAKNMRLIKNWNNKTFSPFPQAYKYKKELLEIEKLEEEDNYLEHLEINSEAALQLRKKYIETVQIQLNKKRGHLYYQKKMGEDISLELEEINDEIKNIRKEGAILNRILTRMEDMNCKEKAIIRPLDQEKNRKREECI